jgi:hypothetical protein
VNWFAEERLHSIAVDLQDAKSAAKALEAAGDVTHLFYAAWTRECCRLFREHET